jgi:hypothetical protein
LHPRIEAGVIGIDSCSFQFSLPEGGDAWADGLDPDTNQRIMVPTLKDVKDNCEKEFAGSHAQAPHCRRPAISRSNVSHYPGGNELAGVFCIFGAGQALDGYLTRT